MNLCDDWRLPRSRQVRHPRFFESRLLDRRAFFWDSPCRLAKLAFGIAIPCRFKMCRASKTTRALAVPISEIRTGCVAMAGCVRFEQLDQRFGSRLALLHCRQSVDCRRQDSVTDSLPNLLDLLRADGVVRCATARLTPLAGGVSSEIYRVDDGSDSFVVKRRCRN